MKKEMIFLTALALMISSMPAFAAHADAYAVGDVDMDGIITGHDAAVISRYLACEDVSLTDAQLRSADVNYDGIVDEKDAAAIHANQEYALGDVNQDGYMSLGDAVAAAGMIGTDKILWTADADGDGDIDVGDYWLIIGALYTDNDFLAEVGQYYYSYDIVESEYLVINALGDVDNDGKLTGHDSAMISRYVMDDTYTLTENQLDRADVNGDGVVDQTDAQVIMMNQQYMLGDVNMDGTISIEDAALVLGAYAGRTVQSSDSALTDVQKNLADVDLDEFYEMKDGIVILTYYAYDSSHTSMSQFSEDMDYYYMAALSYFVQGK